MNMTRSAPLMRLILLLVVCLGLAGCKSQCRLLSEKLCECALNTNERGNCVNRAASLESNNPATPDQETACRVRLLANDCDCRLIDTAEGKVRCGLARGFPDSGS